MEILPCFNRSEVVPFYTCIFQCNWDYKYGNNVSWSNNFTTVTIYCGTIQVITLLSAWFSAISFTLLCKLIVDGWTLNLDRSRVNRIETNSLVIPSANHLLADLYLKWSQPLVSFAELFLGQSCNQFPHALYVLEKLSWQSGRWLWCCRTKVLASKRGKSQVHAWVIVAKRTWLWHVQLLGTLLWC